MIAFSYQFKESNMIKVGIILIVLQAIATIAMAAAGMFHLSGFANALGYFSISIAGVILIVVGYRRKHRHDNDQNENQNNNNHHVLIILGDFCPQGNFLLLRYIHRAYQFIDNLYFLYSLSVYPLRSSNVNLIYKTIQNFGRQFLYIGITLYQ